MAFKKEVKYEIINSMGVVSEQSSGWKKELNRVSWNGGEPKYDIHLLAVIDDGIPVLIVSIRFYDQFSGIVKELCVVIVFKAHKDALDSVFPGVIIKESNFYGSG